MKFYIVLHVKNPTMIKTELFNSNTYVIAMQESWLKFLRDLQYLLQ